MIVVFLVPHVVGLDQAELRKIRGDAARILEEPADIEIASGIVRRAPELRRRRPGMRGDEIAHEGAIAVLELHRDMLDLVMRVDRHLPLATFGLAKRRTDVVGIAARLIDAVEAGPDLGHAASI